MDLINSLRQKSPAVKKQIAFGTSAVVTLAIFGSWLMVSQLGFGQKTPEATAAVAESSNSDVNPFSAFIAVLSKGWGGLTNNINQVKAGADTAKEFVGAISAADSTTTSTDSGSVTGAGSVPNPQKDAFTLTGDSNSGGEITQ
ncbi:TPA: hypothetical protein DCQ44_00680 [Candidatus Taylorbacteria bacterium]|nr:hypothetical protein [Candidatus Taylorbacteria bacterium]